MNLPHFRKSSLCVNLEQLLCSFWDQRGGPGFVTWWLRVLFKVTDVSSVWPICTCSWSWRTGPPECSSEQKVDLVIVNFLQKILSQSWAYSVRYNFIPLVHKHHHTEDVSSCWEGFRISLKNSLLDLGFHCGFFVVWLIVLVWVCLLLFFLLKTTQRGLSLWMTIVDDQGRTW